MASVTEVARCPTPRSLPVSRAETMCTASALPESSSRVKACAGQPCGAWTRSAVMRSANPGAPVRCHSCRVRGRPLATRNPSTQDVASAVRGRVSDARLLRLRVVTNEADVDRPLAAGIPRVGRLVEADALSFPQQVEARLRYCRPVEKQISPPGCPVRHDEAEAFVTQTGNRSAGHN